MQNYDTKLDCCVWCRKTVFVVNILHSHKSILLNSWNSTFHVSDAKEPSMNMTNAASGTQDCAALYYSISLLRCLLLSTAVDKGCIGWYRISVRYSCCVQEDDNQDTLYIQFATWSVPCQVIVCAVIWCVSKVVILFAILVLLMQF
jgi:hypothetical protein